MPKTQARLPNLRSSLATNCPSLGTDKSAVVILSATRPEEGQHNADVLDDELALRPTLHTTINKIQDATALP